MAGPRLGGTYSAQRYQADAYPHWLHETTETPACRGVDVETFFPEHRHTIADVARTHCAVCPLKAKCLKWALEQPPTDLHGIWGGTSQKQRERIIAARKAAA